MRCPNSAGLCLYWMAEEETSVHLSWSGVDRGRAWRRWEWYSLAGGEWAKGGWRAGLGRRGTGGRAQI